MNRWSGRIVFLILCIFLGCVPSPSENANEPPKTTDLTAFFIPKNPSSLYLWRHTPQLPSFDSSYFVQYVDDISGKTPEGFSPISKLLLFDTTWNDTTIKEAYISDTLIMLYFGAAIDPNTPHQIVLKDTLKVGASWIASDNFRTRNGSLITINALVESYYAETSSRNRTFNDVYRISYSVATKGSQDPLEPEYQNGTKYSVYYARGIGDFLEICRNSQDSLVFTNELMETRAR